MVKWVECIYVEGLVRLLLLCCFDSFLFSFHLSVSTCPCSLSLLIAHLKLLFRFLLTLAPFPSSSPSLLGKYPSDKEPNSAEDIQRQQEDLQAKILSLLGSNAVVPSANSPPSQQPARSSTYSTTRTVSYPQPGASSNSYSSSYGSSSDGVGSGGGGGGGGGGYGSCAYNYR